MKLSLERLIPLAFLLAIILLIILAVFAYRSVTALNEAMVWEIQTQEILQKLDKTLINVIDAETGVRGFIITRNENFLAPYFNSDKESKENIASLRQFFSNSPSQKQRIADLENLINAKFVILRRQIETRRTQEEEPITARIIETGQGREVMDKIRAAIGEMKNEEIAILRERENELNRSYRQAFYVITSGSVAGIVLLILANAVILRETYKRGQAEKDLKNTNKNLESRIEKRTKSLVDANEALRNSGILNEAILNSLSSHIAVVDKNGNIISVNNAWKKFSEENRSDDHFHNYVGMNYLDSCRTDVEYNGIANTVCQNLKRLLNGEIKDFSIEYPCHSETEKRWFLLNATALQTPEGGAVIAHTNITDRKQAEAEREKLLASEQEARQEAETANRMRDEFLATVSHELRNPLNAILGWARMLEKNDLDESNREKAITTIVRNADSQNRLIEDLLDVSRIITGKLRLDVQTIRPQAFVEAAIETVRPAAEAKNIELKTLIDQSANKINGDPNRLQQVVWNLLSNAIKFTPKDGEVTVKVGCVESMIEIEVSDNGAGIAKEFLPHVFDRFRQADASTVRKFGGLGLGLAIVRHITEMHGGTVEVESEGEGKGSTFRVKLPIMAISVEADDVASTGEVSHFDIKPSVNLNGISILAVDDEEDTRSLLAQVLKHYGAAVETAASAAEGYSKFLAKKPDIIISDIGMPEEDGYSLMRRIRSLPDEQGKIPAIALTAFARPQDRMLALASGFQTHVTKPVEPDELAAVIGSLIGRLQFSENN